MRFCSNCGSPSVAEAERAVIDAYVEARVRKAVDAKMSDQNLIVRHVADDAEDIVWKHIRRYSWVVAVVIFLLGLYGFNSIREAKTTIVNEAHSRLDPIISNTEQRVKEAQKEIGNTQGTISSIKEQLDETSQLAQEQSSRISQQGGEINKKLQQLQKDSDQANQLSSKYQEEAAKFQHDLQQMRKQAEAENQKLEQTQRTYSERIDQVTQQFYTVSIDQAYSSLGKRMYVTFNGRPWRGKAAKQPAEKWVNVNLDPTAIEQATVSKKELKTLADQLEKRGYTPLFGMFGVAGPIGTGFDCMSGDRDGVVYFNPKNRQEALQLGSLASVALHIPILPIRLPQPTSQAEQFVVQNSGLDFQICVTGSGQ